ncbi:hypothetical protein K439DRAFT_1616011 [Ramaria rubella]|nr:hypothetical protein K439DRAFT_1616011 [Ramaria rubella]
MRKSEEKLTEFPPNVDPLGHLARQGKSKGLWPSLDALVEYYERKVIVSDEKQMVCHEHTNPATLRRVTPTPTTSPLGLVDVHQLHPTPPALCHCTLTTARAHVGSHTPPTYPRHPCQTPHSRESSHSRTSSHPYFTTPARPRAYRHLNSHAVTPLAPHPSSQVDPSPYDDLVHIRFAVPQQPPLLGVPPHTTARDTSRRPHTNATSLRTVSTVAATPRALP